MRFRAVLFDLDGTLVDSNEQHVLAWDEAFRAYGHAIEPQRIHDQIGKGADGLVPALLPGASESEAEALGQASGEIFKRKYLEVIRPFAEARALLVRLDAAGLRLALASSASKAEVDHYLDLLDAKQLIEVSTSADDVEHTKPAPDIFATALKKLGLAGSDAVVIGDTPYDIEAASHFGTAAIAVRSGGFSDQALANAIAIYDDVAALLAAYQSSVLAR